MKDFPKHRNTGIYLECMARSEALDASKALVTMEGCDMKSNEVLAEEEEIGEVDAACKAACTPKELAGMTEEEQD